MIESLSAEPLYEVILFLFRKEWNRRDLANRSVAETTRDEKRLASMPSQAFIKVSRLRKNVLGGGLATLLSVPLSVRLTSLFSSTMASDVFCAKKTWYESVGISAEMDSMGWKGFE